MDEPGPGRSFMSKPCRLRHPIALFPLLLLAGASLFAQTPTATITGIVVDPSGATVPEATVIVVNTDTNVRTQASSNVSGAFTVVRLLPGNYVLTVSKTGFKTVALPAFKLDVNQTL